jgi:hypothetical protein
MRQATLQASSGSRHCAGPKSPRFRAGRGQGSIHDGIWRSSSSSARPDVLSPRASAPPSACHACLIRQHRHSASADARAFGTLATRFAADAGLSLPTYLRIGHDPLIAQATENRGCREHRAISDEHYLDLVWVCAANQGVEVVRFLYLVPVKPHDQVMFAQAGASGRAIRLDERNERTIRVAFWRRVQDFVLQQHAQPSPSKSRCTGPDRRAGGICTPGRCERLLPDGGRPALWSDEVPEVIIEHGALGGPPILPVWERRRCRRCGLREPRGRGWCVLLPLRDPSLHRPGGGRVREPPGVPRRAAAGLHRRKRRNGKASAHDHGPEHRQPSRSPHTIQAAPYRQHRRGQGARERTPPVVHVARAKAAIGRSWHPALQRPARQYRRNRSNEPAVAGIPPHGLIRSCRRFQPMASEIPVARQPCSGMRCMGVAGSAMSSARAPAMRSASSFPIMVDIATPRPL